jgi:hypothetical protein
VTSRGIVPGIVAAAVMALVLYQTSDALRSQLLSHSGHAPRARSAALDPYARLDGLIAAGSRDVLPSTMRDPFGYGTLASASGEHPHRVVKGPTPVAVEKPMPVLTAVVSDADPQAVIRFEGKNYTVRAGSLFADFRVVSVTADQVVLDRNGEEIVLHRASKGE